METNGWAGESAAGIGMCPSVATNRLDILAYQFNIEITVELDDFEVATQTDESYTLSVLTKSTGTTCSIVAPTFFGARINRWIIYIRHISMLNYFPIIL